MAFCTCISIFSSCKKDISQTRDLSTPINSETQLDKISTKEGVLIFSDRKTFNATVEKLSLMTREQADSWEKTHHFVSQRNIFDKIADAEIKFFETSKDISPEEFSKMYHHSELYKYYLDQGIITEFEKGTDDEYYNYSIYNGSYAKIVNKNGLIAINDTIYQLTNDEFKMLADGDFNKIPVLLKSHETDPDKKIIVNKIATYKTTQKTEGVFDWSRSSGWVTNGSKRILLSVTFNSNLSGGGSTCFSNHNVNVQCMEKNWYGSWVYVFTYTTISGTWGAKERMINGAVNNYSPGFAYNNNINNFNASISPTSGTTSPYPSTFQYYAQSGNNFWYELEVYNVYWRVTRNGGCCGIVATISK